MRKFRGEGVFARLVTPFTTDYKLDEEALRRHVDFLVEKGVHALATNAHHLAEQLSLSDEEIEEINRIVVEQAKGKAFVIAFVGRGASTTASRLANIADHCGLDAAMVGLFTYPQLYPLGDEEMYAYQKAVAEATEIPLIYYNNPRCTGNNATPAVLEKLLSEFGDRYIACREENVSQIPEHRARIGDKFPIFFSSVWDMPLAYSAWGVKGVIQDIAYFMPEKLIECHNALINGNLKRGIELVAEIGPLIDAMTGKIGPWPSVLKAALDIVGLPAGVPRPPLLPLSGEKKEELRSVLKKHEVLKP